jgi:hypothetical protein
MSLRQRIHNYLSTRSHSRLRGHSHKHDKDSVMSKRQRSESGESIDLDKELRPRKQHRSLPTKGVKTDPENLMDNWYLSSRDSGNQKTSKERYEKNAWEARRHLPQDLSNIRGVAGRWEYTTDETMKRWVDASLSSQNRYNMRGLTKGARNLALTTVSNPPFPAEKGDREISRIYREFWVANDKDGFLETLYKYVLLKTQFRDVSYTNTLTRTYAEEDGIPEETVWRIFRCLISELVPHVSIARVVPHCSYRADSTKGDKWKTAPANIIAEANTIWQVGKCMLQIVTRGRFWDEELNVLNPVDSGEKFGEYKQNTLHVKYSKNLMKYILGCLSARDVDRFTRPELLSHFEEVFSVYNGTHKAPIMDDIGDAPYEPTDPRIPKGLTNEEGEVYEKLIKIAEDRVSNGTGVKTPHIITITDLAKDYDDLMAMMCLKELHRLGIVHVEGFVANLMPADRRALFGRGALDSLKLYDTPCAIGTLGDPNRILEEGSHEFDNTGRFMALESTKDTLPDGQDLLERVFTKAIKDNHKVTLLGISSLMDIAEFAKEHKDLLINGLENVVLQGGYRVIENVLTADPAAANNKFDMDGANQFHAFMQEHKIPSTVWTKVATEAVPIYNTLFEFLEQTDHPLGPYIRQVQVNQDLNFYARACTGPLFAPHMTQDWYVRTKSTWFAAGHEPDEPYPLGKDMVPFFTKVVAYDALAAVGAAGEDVLQAFNIIRPFTSRPDAYHPTHRLVGVPRIMPKGEQPGMPQDQNLDGHMMGVVITALMKGSILAVQQGLECPPQ